MNHLPSSNEVLDALSKKIQNSLITQLSDTNSILRKNFQDKLFASPLQIQLTLKESFLEIWKKGGDIATEAGFLGNPDLLHNEKYSIQEELDILSKRVFDLFEPAIFIDSTTNKHGLSFDNEAIEKITDRLEREVKGIHDAKYLKMNEENQLANMSQDRLIAMLKEAPSRLRGELRNTGYPSSIKFNQFSEGAVFKGIETIVLTGSFGFMVYGWHGIVYNMIDSGARNARNVAEAGKAITETISPSVYEQIIANPMIRDSLTYGAGFFAASAIGWGLLKGARTRREYLIKDSEQSATQGKKVIVGNAFQRNGLFAATLAFAIMGAGIEAAGILSHEVQGIYTAQKAHEVGNTVSKILNITDKESAAGKINTQLADAPEKIQTNANNWYTGEVSRPGAGGAGPAAVAKQYLKDGLASLDLSMLGRDQNLYNSVINADRQISEVIPTLHKENPTFSSQAQAIHNRYANATTYMQNLAYGPIDFNDDGEQVSGLYTSVYEKGRRAKTADYLSASDRFTEELNKYEDNLGIMDTKWKQAGSIYQGYINQVSAIADAKYASKLPIDASVPDITIDLTEVKAKIAEKPKLEAKSPLEYWGELKKLTDVPGGITSSERYGIIALIALRSGIIELAAGLMLIWGLRRVRNYYGRPDNLLSKKEKELIDTHYENIVTSIEKTFSDENWRAIFPDHMGITRKDADYLARKLIVSKDPELATWLPVKLDGGEEKKHILRNMGAKTATFYKNVLTGNTATSKEQYLAKLNQVLTNLSESAIKDRSGIGISLTDIQSIVNHVFPSGKIEGKKNTPVEVFSDKVSSIAKNLDTISENSLQTQNDHALERDDILQEDIKELQDWSDTVLSIWIGQCETNILSSSGDDMISLGKIEEFVRNAKKFQNEIKNPEYPTPHDVTQWKKQKQIIIIDFNSL